MRGRVESIDPRRRRTEKIELMVSHDNTVKVQTLSHRNVSKSRAARAPSLIFLWWPAHAGRV